MLKFLITSVILGVSALGNIQVEASPLSPVYNEYCWISEVGFVFPTKPVAIRDFYAANKIIPNPLTSGLGYGTQIGRHILLENGSTIGVVANANMFYSSTQNTSQIYQFSTYFLARAYMDDYWRRALFFEIGVGPEVSATSFNDSDFIYQANISTRIGVGYNYKFNQQFSVGATFVVVPSVVSSSPFDGSRIIVSMLW